MDTAPACVCCSRELRDHEAGRNACTRCQTRIDGHLAALAGPHGLYARLSSSLMPGRTGTSGGRVTGSRTAPLPLRLDSLTLEARGGVVTVLQLWVEDWASYGHAAPGRGGGWQQQLDDAVATLRFNLDWACCEHPAVDEFAREVSQIRGQCEAAVTGERPEQHVTVVCDCGQPITITLSTQSRRCPRCRTEHGWADLRALPLANRAAA